jgi:hypothetical protein
MAFLITDFTKPMAVKAVKVTSLEILSLLVLSAYSMKTLLITLCGANYLLQPNQWMNVSLTT